MDDLKLRILQSNPDMVFITETWFTSDHSESLLSIENYSMFRVDRIGRGGGCCVWSKSCLNFYRMNPPTKIQSTRQNKIDVIWLVSDVYKFIICRLYIPPNQHMEECNSINKYIL